MNIYTFLHNKYIFSKFKSGLGKIRLNRASVKCQFISLIKADRPIKSYLTIFDIYGLKTNAFIITVVERVKLLGLGRYVTSPNVCAFQPFCNATIINLSLNYNIQSNVMF